MAELKGYHAHVYFDAATRPTAERVREAIVAKFPVKAGPFADEPRGPHPIPQFNIIFETSEFQNIVPWLMFNREGLNVLAAGKIFESLASSGPSFPSELFTGTPAQLEELRQRVTGRQGRY
jgi:aromatic ring-cleaving dioxygenase